MNKSYLIHRFLYDLIRFLIIWSFGSGLLFWAILYTWLHPGDNQLNVFFKYILRAWIYFIL